MITRRASVTALAAVAVAGLASGCLSSNSGSSSGGGTAAGPGKGTVEVMYGFGADSEAGLQGGPQQVRASANGFTIKFTKAAVVGHRDPRARRRWQPAGRRASSRSPASCATSPSRRRSWPGTTPTSRRDEQTWYRVRRAPARAPTARSTASRPRSASRASSGTTSRTSGDRRTQLPKTLDEMLTLTDQLKAAGQDAVVHRGRVRQRHRLADHRLDRGPCPASGRPGRTTTSGSPAR